MKLKRKQIGILLIAGAVIYFWWLKRQEKVNGDVDDVSTPSGVNPPVFVVENVSPSGRIISRERIERT
jgi:hypothetical protein|tara:strand:- start:2010 stop:2213 length:204 start_codon:yes stop_codon:yes gene_type:complete